MNRSRREIRSIGLFLLAGLVAFGVDYGLYRAGVQLGAGPPLARALSWLAAVTTTYAINSGVTFQPPPAALRQDGLQRPRHRDRYLPYVATQGLGGIVSFATFLALLPRLRPLPALAMATLAATLCNYLGARTVLSPRRTSSGGRRSAG
ncbi:GtrA family protein [Cyanobium sp. FGCU-52]|nr:GtrA family protein [Cyanobium sp. FGCU52]